MIKTIDLKIEAFRQAEEQFKKLDENKEALTPKIYKATEKLITKQLKQNLKQIDKQYPIEKEVEKFLKKD